MKNVTILSTVLLLAACASSPYTYYVEPTPLKKQETTYSVSDVNVELVLGHGADPESKQFADRTELQSQFKKYIESSLEKKGLLATNQSGGMSVTVNIEYTRTFNYGGKALNKPVVSHHVVLSDEHQKLASFSHQKYTTKYGMLEDTAVNLEIAAFSWDEEDEPKDIEFISELIVEDIVNAGS